MNALQQLSSISKLLGSAISRNQTFMRTTINHFATIGQFLGIENWSDPFVSRAPQRIAQGFHGYRIIDVPGNGNARSVLNALQDLTRAGTQPPLTLFV